MNLISNGSATGSALTWGGGPGIFTVVGTFSGATCKLQMLGPDATTYVDVYGCSLTAAGMLPFTLPAGTIRAAVTGGPPSGIYADAGILHSGSMPFVTAAGAGGGAATIADGANVVEGAVADAAATAGGTGTISAKLRRISTQIPAAVGTAAMAASMPVTLATDDKLISTIFAEDVAAAGGEFGQQALGVRQDARTSPVSASGDWHGLVFDQSGRLKIWRSGSAGDWSAAGTLTSGSATTIKTSAGSGVRNRINAIQISHTLLGAATVLAIRDGAGGTVLWNVALDTTLSQGQGYVIDPPVCGGNATLLEVILLTNPVSGSVYANVQGDVITS